MYKCDAVQVLRWQRAAVYVQYVRQQLGPVAAAVYTDVLRHGGIRSRWWSSYDDFYAGKVRASACVQRVAAQESDYDESKLRSIFEGLVNARYIVRAPMSYAENADDACPLREPNMERFALPTKDDFETTDVKQRASAVMNRKRSAGRLVVPNLRKTIIFSSVALTKYSYGASTTSESKRNYATDSLLILRRRPMQMRSLLRCWKRRSALRRKW